MCCLPPAMQAFLLVSTLVGCLHQSARASCSISASVSVLHVWQRQHQQTACMAAPAAQACPVLRPTLDSPHPCSAPSMCAGPRAPSTAQPRRSTAPHHRSTRPRARSTAPLRRSTAPPHRSTAPPHRSTAPLMVRAARAQRRVPTLACPRWRQATAHLDLSIRQGMQMAPNSPLPAA
jgi:hypothetical protein